MIVFYLLIGTVSVVGNFVVLFVVYKSKQLRHSQYVYKCSIAVSDIIWGFSMSYCFLFFCIRLLGFDSVHLLERNGFKNKIKVNTAENNITTFKYQLEHVKLMTLSIYKYISLFNNYVMYVLLFLTPVTILVSFISLLFASIDRYVALTFPFKYKQLNTIKIAKMVSIFVWSLSAIVNTVTLILSLRSHYWSIFLQPVVLGPPDGNYSSNQNTTAIILYILFSLLWIFTFLTLFSMYKSFKRSSSLNKNTKKRVSLEKRMSLILIFMVVAFTFSLFPTIYFNVHLYLAPELKSANRKSPNDTFLDENSFFVSVAFLTTNSVWNFVIYNILNKKFREAVIKVCFKRT